MKIIKRSTLLFLFLYFVSGTLFAQNWDYEPYPRADADLTHLDAEIRIEADGRLQGDIIYSATIRNSFADSIFFDAAGLDIQSVALNDRDAEFLVQDLKLIIVPDESFPRGDEVQIAINYLASPSFGVHRSQSGTMWTSLLPRTTQHWLPVIDSPWTQLLTDFIFTHPAGTTIVSNGRKGISEVADTEYERTSFSTGQPVSASSLGWALFDEVQISSSVTSEQVRDSYNTFSRRSGPQIYVYSETGTDPETVLQQAAQKVHQISTEKGVNVLEDDLHIFVLENDFMETKQFGDGLLFIYENKGNTGVQVERGIVSMFAESIVEAPTWSDSDAARITEAYFMNHFDVVNPDPDDQNYSPYQAYSTGVLKRWQLYLENESHGLLSEGMEVLLGNVSETSLMVEGWEPFSRRLYEATGHSWMDGIELPAQEPLSEDTTYTYSAVIDWEEGSTSAEIRFEAQGPAVNELVTVQAEVIGLSSTQVREFTITGASDGVVLNVPSTLENIKISVQNREDVAFITEKPFFFWMVQLRGDESEERRAEAAIGISSYSDNPDIELLLNDMLRGEESDRVIANILKAMAVITNGASGTDERFLQFAGSQYDITIRTAAVEALGNYDGNERVISRLQSVLRQESSDSLRKAALFSISEIMDTQRLVSITGSMISNDAITDLIPELLYILAGKDAAEEAVELADQALEMNLPYDITQQTVRFLLETDQSDANWMDRLPGLMNNPHPGVRIIAAEAAGRLSPDERDEILETVLPNEFDERVRRQLVEN
jgi:hypothetical protein